MQTGHLLLLEPLALESVVTVKTSIGSRAIGGSSAFGSAPLKLTSIAYCLGLCAGDGDGELAQAHCVLCAVVCELHQTHLGRPRAGFCGWRLGARCGTPSLPGVYTGHPHCD